MSAIHLGCWFRHPPLQLPVSPALCVSPLEREVAAHTPLTSCRRQSRVKSSSNRVVSRRKSVGVDIDDRRFESFRSAFTEIDNAQPGHARKPIWGVLISGGPNT